MGLSDAAIVERALENGWALDENPEHNSFGLGGYWRRDGEGIPFGTFAGPRWETVDGKWVKTSDGPYTLSPADAMRSKLDHDDRCEECGRWIEYGYFNLRPPARFCWLCQLWLERVDELGGARDGSALRGMRRSTGRPFVSQDFAYYGIGPTVAPSPHNGFGGSWFTVEFLNGATVETCDLWLGGTVPERFRDRLPMTATLRPGRLKT